MSAEEGRIGLGVWEQVRRGETICVDREMV